MRSSSAEAGGVLPCGGSGRHADVIVVGLGAVGAAALYQLALRGVRAVGIDRFDPPHDRGSTHGGTRITRLAVGEGEAYVPLVRRSHEIWRDLEDSTGMRLLQQVGGLIMASGQSQRYGTADFLGDTVGLAQRFAIAHEVLDAAEIRRRYPQFLVADDARGYFEPEAGLLDPEGCVAAQLAEARRLGAQTCCNEMVLDIAGSGNGVAVVTDKGRYEAGNVIVAAGAWASQLAGGAFGDDLLVRRQVMLWFVPDAPERWQPENCPVFIWFHGRTAAESVYGFPMTAGSRGVKVGTEQFHDTTDPDAVDRAVADGEIRTMYEKHVARRLSGVSARCAAAATCLYTVAPEGRFQVRSHARAERALVVSACSGHGFKHSAAVGEALAQEILGERDGPNLLAPFAKVSSAAAGRALAG